MLKWIDIVRFAMNGNFNPKSKIIKTDEEWKKILTEEQYRVTRNKGTERPNSSPMCNAFEPGIYACVCCGNLLFDAEKKFDSGTGWPSFTQPIQSKSIGYIRDSSYGMDRIEAICNFCEAHLGHVFPDGPAPGGLRYCMNAVSLVKTEIKMDQIVIGGGCFWCTEAIFENLKGVIRVESGYSGGEIPKPTYREVCSGLTGHAEVVQITYNPEIISYDDLLKIHLSTHNPTTINQQGADKGTQYRSIIFFKNGTEKNTAQQIINEMQVSFDKKIVTEIKQFEAFYKAEESHQQYYNLNKESAYCEAVIEPKLEKFKKLFRDKLNTIMLLSIMLVSLTACNQTSSKKQPKSAANDQAELIQMNWKTVENYIQNGNLKPPKRVIKSADEWKRILSKEQFEISRLKETERPFSSSLCYRFEPGKYACICCGTLLFDSGKKFDSGTGWPSFSQPIQSNVIAYIADKSLGMSRVEVNCNVCDAHLGHVFPDGPEPTGLRFCINALALKKIEEASKSDTLVIGGGCFWCTEAIFEELNGVKQAVSGYCGGERLQPTYKQVSTGQTGHAEVVQIIYDPIRISYADILRVHMSTHDATTLNKQGADEGTQYRSVIFYKTEAERDSALKVINEFQKESVKPIVTEVKPLQMFAMAENEHQDFYQQNKQYPYCEMVIQPKLEKFRKLFKSNLK